MRICCKYVHDWRLTWISYEHIKEVSHCHRVIQPIVHRYSIEMKWTCTSGPDAKSDRLTKTWSQLQCVLLEKQEVMRWIKWKISVVVYKKAVISCNPRLLIECWHGMKGMCDGNATEILGCSVSLNLLNFNAFNEQSKPILIILHKITTRNSLPKFMSLIKTVSSKPRITKEKWHSALIWTHDKIQLIFSSIFPLILHHHQTRRKKNANFKKP